MAVNERYAGAEREAMWQRVMKGIGEGRVKTTRLVMEELKRNDPDAFKRLSPHRRALVVPDQHLAGVAGRIAHDFPKMSRPLAPKEKADQWVVALGQTRALTVVTEEGTGSGRMPSVCNSLDLACIRLADMLARLAEPS